MHYKSLWIKMHKCNVNVVKNCLCLQVDAIEQISLAESAIEKYPKTGTEVPRCSFEYSLHIDQAVKFHTSFAVGNQHCIMEQSVWVTARHLKLFPFTLEHVGRRDVLI